MVKLEPTYFGIPRPLYTHKRYFMRILASHPEEMPKAFPDWNGTVKELLDTLRKSPKEYFCYGKFLTKEELEQEDETYLASQLEKGCKNA